MWILHTHPHNVHVHYMDTSYTPTQSTRSLHGYFIHTHTMHTFITWILHTHPHNMCIVHTSYSIHKAWSQGFNGCGHWTLGQGTAPQWLWPWGSGTRHLAPMAVDGALGQGTAPQRLGPWALGSRLQSQIQHPVCRQGHTGPKCEWGRCQTLC